jgi:serine/threonine-protein kinase RsbT
VSRPDRAPVGHVRAVLGAYVSRVTAQGMLLAAANRAGIRADDLDRVGLDAAMLAELRTGVSVFVPEARRSECLARLAGVIREVTSVPVSGQAIHVGVADEHGIVDARTRARSCAADIGFGSMDQHRIATAVSELARNMFRYAGGGELRIEELRVPKAGIAVVARDGGPGIPHLAEVLGGSYRSRSGLGKGLLGCKRMMDDFGVDTGARGTTVTVKKYL